MNPYQYFSPYQGYNPRIAGRFVNSPMECMKMHEEENDEHEERLEDLISHIQQISMREAPNMSQGDRINIKSKLQTIINLF